MATLRQSTEVLINEVRGKACSLESSEAPLPEFTNVRLKDELLQQLVEYEDPVTKVMKRQWWGCKVISVVNKPTGQNPIALLKVTWEPMDHLGWSSSTENAQFDTRLWNDDAQLIS